MRFISIDPGINGCAALWTDENKAPQINGWGRAGRLNTDLLMDILNSLRLMVKERGVTLIVMERPHHSAMRGGGFQSVLFDDVKMMTERDLGIKFKYIAPNSVKKKVTGNGRASKSDITNSVVAFFESRNKVPPACNTEHDWDACAIGIAWLKRRSEGEE